MSASGEEAPCISCSFPALPFPAALAASSVGWSVSQWTLPPPHTEIQYIYHTPGDVPFLNRRKAAKLSRHLESKVSLTSKSDSGSSSTRAQTVMRSSTSWFLCFCFVVGA